MKKGFCALTHIIEKHEIKRNNSMKINDIFEHAIQIDEVFNTKIPIEQWITDGSNKIGFLTIDNQKFRIKLEARTYKQYSFINIAFEIYSDELHDWTTDATLNNKSASKVIGAIINGVIPEVEKYESDALVFFAQDNVDKRMRIYNHIASLYMKKFGHIRENISLPNGNVCTILYTSKLSKADVDAIIDTGNK